MAYSNERAAQCLAIAKQITVVLDAVLKGQVDNSNYQAVYDAITNGTDVADAFADAATVIIASSNDVLKVQYPVT